MRSVALLFVLVPLAAAAQLADTARQPATPVAAPRTAFAGPVLEFDFPAMLIGTAEYDDGPTGVTVFHFPARVAAAVDVRGGAPGTVNTDALRLAYGAQMTAIVLAGGSWQGLAAVTGAADAIRAQRVARGEAPPIVGTAGAIVNDLGFGASIRRFSDVTPDARLAAAAVQAARPGRFHLGARGAGRYAMTGAVFGLREFSGQGGAFRQVGATKIAVFTVVNAAGLVVDRTGRVVRCRAMRTGGECGTIAERLRARIDTMAAARPGGGGPSENTTITMVVTNQRLEPWALERLAAQVHTSMARGIQPFATVGDGDVLFAVTTAEVDNPRLSPGELTLLASELAWDAVLSSVPAGDPPLSMRPIAVDARTLDAYVGDYELGPAARVVIRRDGDRLVAESTRGGQYFPVGAPTVLVPIGPREFLLETPGGDRLRFESVESGRAAGFTLNPGQWALTARRVGQ